jgi:hypothetical protein
MLSAQDQTRVGDFIRQQQVQPVTNINFSLSVGTTVPTSVRLRKFSGELLDLFPNYRDFDFFVAREELVIVDPGRFAIVAFVPISGADTVGVTAPPARTPAAVNASPQETTGNANAAPPRETTGSAAQEPPPAKKKATRTQKTVTERDTTRRRPSHTETDVTVGTSRRDVEEFDAPPPDRPVGPRFRVEREAPPPRRQSVPFPFSLFFGQ